MVVVCKSFTDHRPFLFSGSSSYSVSTPGRSVRPREEEGGGGEAAEWREVAQGEWRATQQRKRRRPTRKSEFPKAKGRNDE